MKIFSIWALILARQDLSAVGIIQRGNNSTDAIYEASL